METIRAISENPYRILGVLASSTKREIVANIAKIKANNRVGKQVDFQYDLTSILPTIDRSNDSIANAEAELSLQNGQIKHAQFWFIAKSELDKTALNNLSVGNFKLAISIWEKKVSFTSLHNRIICYLMLGDFSTAFDLAQKLYSEYENEFKQSILSDNLDTTNIDLVHSFIDTLSSDITPKEFIEYLNDAEWRKYVINKAITPLIDEIEHSIAKAKLSKKKGPQPRLQAGTKLMNETFKPLNELKGLISSSDTRLCLLADKLGIEILQCGIDYYNESEDSDAAQKAYKLQKYANQVVMGTMAKERCKENISILEDIISKLPPQEVITENNEIEKALKEFNSKSPLIINSIRLIKRCAPFIVSIKSKLGVNNSYYIKISTRIVNNALSYVIDEVNSVLKEENCPFYKLKETLIEAWRTTLYLDKFNIEETYKISRYDKNRQALYKIINEVKGFESITLSHLYRYGCGFCNNIDVSDLDLRTDSEIFSTCKTISDYEKYVYNFPNGKHINQAKTKLSELKYNECKTIADFEKFIPHCYDESIKQKARIKLEELRRQERAIQSCNNLAEILELYQREKANGISSDQCSMRAYELCTTEDDYRKLINIFSSYSKGGKLSLEKIRKFEQDRADKLANNKAKRIACCIAIIPLAVAALMYISGDIEGFVTLTMFSSAGLFIGAICTLSALERKGMGIITFTTFVTSVLLLIAGIYGIDVSEEIKETRECEALYLKIMNKPLINDCEKYIQRYKYRNSENNDKVFSIWLDLLIDNSNKYDYYSENAIMQRMTFKSPLDKIIDFSKSYSDAWGNKDAEIKITEICDSLYNVANKNGTVKIWNEYRNIVPSEYWKDSADKIKAIENKAWNTDSRAWSTASKLNTIDAYQKYKQLYPRGQYFSKAEKKIIDLEVASVYAGDHGSLPSMDKIGYGSGPTSTITVRNNTSYVLTLLYSGTDSKRLVLLPGETSSITLKNGNYKVAASVSSASVGRYAGSESLTGGRYDVEYYISSYRY